MGRNTAARQQCLCQQHSIPTAARRTHHSTEVRGIGQQPHIAVQKIAFQRICQCVHFGIAGGIQHKVGSLRILFPQQSGGPADRLPARLRDLHLLGLLPLALQHTGIIPAALQQQIIRGNAPAPRLQDRLDIVIIVFDLKQLHQPDIRHRFF